MMRENSMPVTIVCAYSSEDENLCYELEMHLDGLQRQGIITVYNHPIEKREEDESGLPEALKRADIILFLISPDFMNSNYCNSVEMVQILERHAAGNVHVIPILLRSASWQSAPFGGFKAFPVNGKPITLWDDMDEAFYDVVSNIYLIIKESLALLWGKKGYAQCLLGEYDQAIASYDEAIRLKPDLESAYTGKAQVLTKLASVAHDNLKLLAQQTYKQMQEREGKKLAALQVKGNKVSEQKEDWEQLHSNSGEMNQNEMEALLAASTTPINIKRGNVVEGVIVRIDQDEILVDIGLKAEGVLSTKELPASGYGSFNELHLNDKVLVYVVQPETSEGHAVLSLKRANTERQWRIAEEQYKNGELLKARVTDYNKGGLIVDVAGIRGFVPISQILNLKREEVAAGGENQETAAKLQSMKDKELQLKIIEVNRARNRLILSERLAVQEWRTRRREELLDELRSGEVRRGVVSNLANFGAFVDLGGADGLVHISQLAWSRVNHPSEVLHVGQEVEVQVLSVDKDKKKIALSIKRAEVDPWTTVEKRYTLGQVVTGVVTKIAPFGAFARIEDGIEGLIHHSELSPGTDPKAILHEGAQLQLRILRIDAERRRLRLSLRQTEEAKEEAATTEVSSETGPAHAGPTEAQVPASTSTAGSVAVELTGVSNTTSGTPSLESLSAHRDHTTRRVSKSERRERAERAADHSIQGGLRTSSEGELTAMAEAFRAAARQRSAKEENDIPEK
jgi:small subunit ribosomal protein S1